MLRRSAMSWTIGWARRTWIYPGWHQGSAPGQSRNRWLSVLDFFSENSESCELEKASKPNLGPTTLGERSTLPVASDHFHIPPPDFDDNRGSSASPNSNQSWHQKHRLVRAMHVSAGIPRKKYVRRCQGFRVVHSSDTSSWCIYRLIPASAHIRTTCDALLRLVLMRDDGRKHANEHLRILEEL